MFLSDVDIEKALKAGDIVIRNFDKARLQPASYDIELGNKFIVNQENKTYFIDPAKKMYAQTQEIDVKDGDEFILHPGVSVLGISRDFFGSDKYLIQLSGKSSLARIGLMVHNTAGLINPGHFLNITFELCNLNNVPIILRPGMSIAQIIFSPLSSPPKANYKKIGRFAKNNWNNYVPPKEAHTRSRRAKK